VKHGLGATAPGSSPDLNMQKFFAILVDGTIYFSWLFIVSIGLTLIYGVMKILNIAHGSFYALGAYTAASAVGAYFAGNYPAAGSFVLLIAAGVAVGTTIGLLVERGLLRPMYGRDEIVLVLVTYAAFLVFEDLIKLVWGVDPYFAYQPYELLGRVSIGGIGFAVYDLGLLALAILVGLVGWWALNRTRKGKLLLVVIHDREISTAMGINVSRMFTVTFVIGATLGALGGALTAPGISVVPGIGVDVIVLAFAVSVIGGLGSIAGAAIGALVVGLARASAVHLLPQVELFVIYAVMAIVLAFRPQGLFGRPAARKI
jgi:branched-chain amino acid transport system permease protein